VPGLCPEGRTERERQGARLGTSFDQATQELIDLDRSFSKLPFERVGQDAAVNHFGSDAVTALYPPMW